LLLLTLELLFEFSFILIEQTLKISNYILNIFTYFFNIFKDFYRNQKRLQKLNQVFIVIFLYILVITILTLRIALIRIRCHFLGFTISNKVSVQVVFWAAIWRNTIISRAVHIAKTFIISSSKIICLSNQARQIIAILVEKLFDFFNKLLSEGIFNHFNLKAVLTY
jgi:hypothetical protein